MQFSVINMPAAAARAPSFLKGGNKTFASYFHSDIKTMNVFTK